MSLDLVLVGAGLANGLLALALLEKRPELQFVVLEKDDEPGGNHTWSFHQGDLTGEQHAQLAPLVSQHWPRQAVVFPAFRRSLPVAYHSMLSERFSAHLRKVLGARLRTNAHARSIAPDRVTLEGGETLQARCVIDGRGFRKSPAMAIRFQSFVGLELRFARPHGLQAPIIMDATTPQDGGYRFTYVLPLTPDTALVEDTGYVDHKHLDRAQLEKRVHAYCAERGWTVAEELRRESGVLPITLAGDIEQFWVEGGSVPRIGLRGGFFHPTTGYSLPDAVRVAELVARLPDLHHAAVFRALSDHGRALWQRQGFYRALNRMLFLAGAADQRWRVMQRFYRLPEPLIERFYAGRLTLSDQMRILVGKPPVPVGEAAKAVLSSRRLLEAI